MRRGTRAFVSAMAGLFVVAVGLPTGSPEPVQAQPGSPDLVISEVYGGGGNVGSTYTHDYIELFNRGTSTVDLSGWSVQYASATGSTWQVTAVSGTLQPGQYYLIQQAPGGGGTTALPTPDVIGTINMAATAGKIALASSTIALSGTCPTGPPVRDFVGYGSTATCFEGTAAAPAPSNTNAVTRGADGCTDTDDNAADLSVVAAFRAGAPRNTTSPLNSCGDLGDPPPPVVTFALWDFEGATIEPAIDVTGNAEASAGDGLGGESFPVGNPAGTSGTSWSFNNWSLESEPDATRYFEFKVDTTDIENIGLAFAERRSGTGPLTFEIHFSIDGATFTQIPVTITTLPNNTDWRSHSFDFSGLDAQLAGESSVQFRIFGYGATGSGGTWRIDDVTFTGTELEGEAQVVITAMRTRGPGGAFDEYVEIRNIGTADADISGWALQGCAAGSGNPSNRVVVPSGTDPLPPGGYFLFVNPTNDQYTGGTAPDLTYSTGIADGGASGARIVDAGGTMVSGVGTTSTDPPSQCAEGGGWAASFPTSAPFDLVRVGDREDATQVTGVNADDFENVATTPRNSAFDATDPPELALTCTPPTTITEGFAAEDGPFVDGKAITATASGGAGDVSFEVTQVTPDPAPGQVTVTEVDGADAEIRFSNDVPGLDSRHTSGTYAVTVEVTDDEDGTATCTVAVRVVPVLSIGEMRGVVPDGANGRTYVSPYALGTPIFLPHANHIAIRGVVTQRTLEENPASLFDFEGFFVQSLDADPADIDGFGPGDPLFADGDPRTSDGVWVSTGTFSTVRTDHHPVQQYFAEPGDIVTLRGPIIEDFQQTVLANPFVVDVVTPAASGVDLDAHVEVPEANPPDDIQEASVYWERLAGMQVEVAAGSLVVSGNDFFSPSTSEFWMIHGEHPVAQRENPDHRRVFRDYHPLAHLGPFDLTEGPGDKHGYRILLGSFGVKATEGDATTTITPARSGDTLVDAVQGGLFFSFAKYQVMVATQPDLARGPDPSASSLTTVERFRPAREYSVMVYNVENLYDFRSDPFSGCDLDPDVVPAGQQPTSSCTPDEAGGSTVTPPFTFAPRSQAEYDAQRIAIAEQILVALRAPDIITIQEAEKQDVCIPVYVEADPAASFMQCDLSAPAPGETMENTDRGSGAPDTVEELALEIFAMSGGRIRYEASGDAVNGRDVRGITQAFLHRTDRVELVPVEELHDDPVLGAGGAIDIPYPAAANRTAVAPWVEQAANPKAVNMVLADGVPVQDGGRFPQSGFVFTRPVQVAKFRIYPAGVGTRRFIESYVTSNHMSAGPDGRVEQRTEQARLSAAVAEAVRDAGGRVLVTGDFNVFPRPDDPFPAFKTNPNRPPSDQLAAMYERGFANLHDVIIDEAPENTYSFIFRGVSQILDHIFVDAKTLNELVVARFIHVNTDYPAHTPGFEPGRGASDHDPLYARFEFRPPFQVRTGPACLNLPPEARPPDCN